MDIESLKHLSELGRLDCTDEELEALLPEMQEILSLMDSIGNFPGLPEEADAAQPLERLREDRPSVPGDGPKNGGEAFWVPRIV